MTSPNHTPARGTPAAPFETIPIVEETAEIHRREVTTGRVRVATHTQTVTETVEAALETVEAKVTRVPIDRYLEAGAPLPQPRIEGALTIIPVLEEVLVVETRLLLREEIHVELQRSVEHVATPISLRKQKADVERLPERPPEFPPEPPPEHLPADPDPQT